MIGPTSTSSRVRSAPGVTTGVGAGAGAFLIDGEPVHVATAHGYFVVI